MYHSSKKPAAPAPAQAAASASSPDTGAVKK